MEWLNRLGISLNHIVAITKFCLETLSVFCVILGLFKTIQLVLHINYRQESSPFSQIRIKFGSWLALALEFQLGADILATTIAPTLEDLLELALIAIIRTFLNYFLNQELEAEYKLQKQKTELNDDQYQSDKHSSDKE